ncbi:MAG: hypothetical protein K8H84_12240 [Sulfuricella denitrificans]|nr:hypothetical protein [Sulfuricella denitrificans]
MLNVAGLQQAFCQECRERTQRALMILGESTDPAALRLCYDQIHQEFDTLYGAARACNRTTLESFFRALAQYARFLRVALADGSGLNYKAHDLLRQGVVLANACEGREDHCLSESAGAVAALMSVMKQKMETARG